MATPQLVTVRDFNTSRFSQLADTSTANIGDILARAEAVIERKLQRPIAPKTITETYRPNTTTLYLRKRPVISITSLTRKYMMTGSPIAIPPTDYILHEDAGIIESSYVAGFYVDITYVAGFATVPEDLKEAILMQAAYFAFSDLEIYGSGDSKEPGIRYFLEDIADIIAPYKQINTAFTR